MALYATPKKAGWINRFGLSPNAKYLAFARNNGEVELHDMDRRAGVWESEAKQLGAGGVQSLEFSPDGSLLLAVGGGSNVGLWETATGKLVTSDLRHQSRLAMAGWNEAGNAFVTASRQGEIRLYELPNPMRSDYLKGVAMTPETAEAIAETLSNRAIEEGRIVSLRPTQPMPHRNWPPCQKSTSTPGKPERAWHLQRARVASSGNQWSAAKFHLERAAVIAPLGSAESQTLFNANLNLGHYDLAEAELDRSDQKTESTEEETSYMPDLAKGWAEDEWQYSGHYPVQDLDTGMGREHLNQESLKLEADETWTTLQPFKPTGVSVNSGDRYVDAPENCLFYVAKIFSIEKAGFYELAFDSDDGMKVWVNGKLVHTFTGARGCFFRAKIWCPYG